MTLTFDFLISIKLKKVINELIPCSIIFTLHIIIVYKTVISVCKSDVKELMHNCVRKSNHTRHDFRDQSVFHIEPCADVSISAAARRVILTGGGGAPIDFFRRRRRQ